MTLLDRLVPTVGSVVLDRYELVEELGRGGFGVVFRATQRGLEEDVALKLLLPQLVVNPQIYGRFEREVQVAKRLRHPNSVRILDCGQTAEGLPFYVMEYVKGENLDDVLEHVGQLSAARTRHIAVQILKSLAEAHAQGVVHRDLKPGNVMLCEIFGERDYAKVLDFGIAKALAEPGGTTNQTATGMILGTPAYMSPEQALGHRQIDGRSDLYAVGLIMAECLMGRPVVEGETPLVLLAQHASKSPLPFPPELQLSPLWPVIDQATQKQREFRFRDATEMREAMEGLGKLPTTDLMLGKPLSEAYGSLELAITETPTEPMSTGQLLDRADLIGTDSRLETGSHEQGPRSDGTRQRSHVSYALLAILLIAVAGAVAAIVGLGSRGEEPSGSDNPALSNPPGIAALDADPGQSVEETLTQIPASPAQEPEMPSNAPSLAATATAVGVAADRLRQAVPATHRVRFAGTEDVRVTHDGRLLGVTPFEGLLPRIDRTLEIHCEREGYHSSDVSVSMLQDAVDVELRRRRSARPAASTSSEPERPSTVTTPAPFGNAPIDNR